MPISQWGLEIWNFLQVSYLLLTTYTLDVVCEFAEGFVGPYLQLME